MSLILFDFDGVLADTLSDMLRFAQEICDELGIRHIVVKEDLSELEVMSFATFGLACEVPEGLIDEFVRRCGDKFAGKKSPPEIFAGLANVIRELATENVIAVVTGNTAEVVNGFLIYHGLSECVQKIYGVDMPGSKVEKIKMAKSQFSAENEATFLIGDSLSDIRAAQETNIKNIAVSWGHQSLEMLTRAQPDFIVHSPKELLHVLSKIE